MNGNSSASRAPTVSVGGGRSPSLGTERNATPIMWKWISRIVIATGVLVLALTMADRLARRGGPLPVIPQANGYETLLAVAHEVSAPQGDLADLGPEAIRQIGRTNREALEALHGALRTETGVPLRIELGWVDKHAEDVKMLKRLAVVLGIQSKAELLDGSTNNSAKCLLDTILLGHAMARGGILSDGINALVVETIGTASLRAQVPHLEAEFCRNAAQELERSEARREQPERILKTEKDWSAASFGLISRMGGLLLRNAEAHRHAEFTRRYQETTRRTRRLMLILGARAVELETGRRVTSPSDLVPGVLKSVPLDPEKGTPMTEIPVAMNER